MTRYGSHLARPRSRLRRVLPVLFFLAGFGIWLHAQETEPESEAAETQPVPAENSTATGAGEEGISDMSGEQAADGAESDEDEDEDEDESSGAESSTGGGTVTLLQIQGAIGPATADFLTRGIEMAEESNATLIVLEMDTPGGLDTSMREIIQGILASSVPVATYVWPQGARAASAGTYILYASHIAAMAPATNLGAATPVAIGAPAPASPTDTACCWSD